MLVQVLSEFADNNLQDALNDVAWEQKPVPWLLEISSEGRFLGAIPRAKEEVRGKRTVTVPLQGRVARSPVNRNSGHHPLICADDIGYVLGPGTWTSKPSERGKQEGHHQAFVLLLRRAAEETGDPALHACVRFYQDLVELEKARVALRDAKPGSVVSLSVDGPVVERQPVQEFWRRHYDTAFSERVGKTTGECMVSGEIGPVAPTHEKVKGVSSLGGQAAGVALMSFDKDAFCSYGWQKNENSPVSPGRAMAYVLALNHLLKTENAHRRDVAGIGFLYWLRQKGEFDWFGWLDAGDEKHVAAMLRFDPNEKADPNQFYMAGVSGNGGRLRVRYWVTDSLSHIKANIKGWHEQLRVAWPWNEQPPAVHLWQIQQAIDREGNPPGHQTLALIRRGIEGARQPLGYSILAAALNRIRHAEIADLRRLRVPAGLIRICVNDLLRQQKGKYRMNEISEGLDPTCRVPAYVCGRLMAEYERLQRQASGGVNASILDRYFSLASTYPAAAFPRIEKLALQHLRKLKRDNGGAGYAIDRRITELHTLLTPNRPYPAKLGLEEQGMFILGYYHQKAESIAQAKSRKQSRNSSTDEPDTNRESE